MFAIDLHAEGWGYRPEEIPEIGAPGPTEALQPLEFGGSPRRISQLPNHPDYYLRWVNDDGLYAQLDDAALPKQWRANVNIAGHYFNGLEVAGIAVPPQRHASIRRQAAGFTSTLYTIVPRYNDLEGLTLKLGAPRYVSRIVECIGKLAAFTLDSLERHQGYYLYDLYELRQFSVAGGAEGPLVYHDTDIRLREVYEATSGGCHSIRHAFASLVLETAVLLEHHGHPAEAAHIRQASAAAACQRHNPAT